jgi:hypothetical protein
MSEEPRHKKFGMHDDAWEDAGSNAIPPNVGLPPKWGRKSKIAFGLVVAGVIAMILWAVLLFILLVYLLRSLF